MNMANITANFIDANGHQANGMVSISTVGLAKSPNGIIIKPAHINFSGNLNIAVVKSENLKPAQMPYIVKIKDEYGRMIYEGELVINGDLSISDLIQTGELPPKIAPTQTQKSVLETYVKKSDIDRYLPDLRLMATAHDLKEISSKLAQKPDRAEIANEIAGIANILQEYSTRLEVLQMIRDNQPDLDGYALKTDLPEKPDLSKYALKSDIPKDTDLSEYAKKTELPPPVDLTDYAKKTDLHNLGQYVKTTDIPDLITNHTREFMTQDQVKQYIRQEIENITTHLIADN